MTITAPIGSGMIRALLLMCLVSRLAIADEAPSYLEQLVSSAEQQFEKEVPDKAAWLANRDRYRLELKEMLGLEPEPPRGDLKPVITGTLSGDEFVVEKLHFQSLPGLYVTANFYRPANTPGKLPTILYLSGHGVEMGKDGRSNGNKTHYQHHGVWFAQHGYNCLIIDTVDLGEIMGEHHGTYSQNRWWWVSRGYTPAGVETWAGIRALDYLTSRPEVDMEKLGVTGRSGGGAYTWYLTAVDDRVKVAAPTAGITTLRDHIIGGCIEGHCDCMYMVNLYGWDFDKVAALTAPRPLLISNTDKDSIFPLGGVYRIYQSTRRLYKLLGAEKNIGLQISEGPHKDTQPLNAGAFHWFERFLKGADPMAVIKEPAVPVFKQDDLRVFAELPKDEINTRIDETFVPMANPPVPQTREEWEKMRDGWMKVLRDKVMKPKERVVMDHCWGVIVHGGYVPAPKGTNNGSWWALKPDADVHMHLQGWYSTTFWRTDDATTFPPPVPPLGKADWDFQIGSLPGVWRDNDKSKPPHDLRRFQLCGLPLDLVNCAEIEYTCNSIQKPQRTIHLHAAHDTAAEALYASLLLDGVKSLDLYQLPASHRQGPHFPGILKYMDIPQAVAMAAERCKVRITGRREDWKWALETAKKMDFAANLEIVPALEIVEVKKIWDSAPHNAFTSLTQFKDEWFCTFREGSSHVPGIDGTVRVLLSKDGTAWESAALLSETGVDLRDPKFCTSEDGRLLLTMGGSIYDGTPAAGAKRKFTGARSRTSFSTDGRTWSAPQPVCEDNQWLWRVTERPSTDPTKSNTVPQLNKFYGISYPTNVPEDQAKLSLWESANGVKFTRLASPDPGRKLWLNETTLRFDESGNMMALARSDRKGTNAFFGISRPPYKEWSWTDTGHIIHGPDFIRLKDGRMFYAGRDIISGKANTTVGILTASGNAMPMTVLPSGGDCSYPGLAEGPDGQLFVSYYSSHEGRTAIYFARLKMVP